MRPEKFNIVFILTKPSGWMLSDVHWAKTGNPGAFLPLQDKSHSRANLLGRWQKKKIHTGRALTITIFCQEAKSTCWRNEHIKAFWFKKLPILGHCLALLEGCNWKNKEQAGALRFCEMPSPDRAPNTNPSTPKQKGKQPSRQKGMCDHHHTGWALCSGAEISNQSCSASLCLCPCFCCHTQELREVWLNLEVLPVKNAVLCTESQNN